MNMAYGFFILNCLLPTIEVLVVHLLLSLQLARECSRIFTLLRAIAPWAHVLFVDVGWRPYDFSYFGAGSCLSLRRMRICMFSG